MILCAALSSLLAGCSSERDIGHYARELPAPWPAKLGSDDAEFRGFALDQGAHFLLLVESHLSFQYETESLVAYELSASVLDPTLERINLLLAEEYGFHRSVELHREAVSIPPRESMELRRRIQAAYEIDRNPSMDAGAKAGGMLAILDELDAVDAPIRRSHLSLRAAAHLGDSGDREGQIRVLDRAIQDAKTRGEYRILCQILGVRGSLAGDVDGPEEMLAYWREAYELALRHRLAGQAGRITLFLSRYYESLGRLAIARDLRLEASEVCNRLGGAPTSLRFYLEWLDFHAGLGCWRIVGEDLARAPVVLDQYKAWIEPRYHGLQRSRIEWIRARQLMASGRIREADKIFERTVETLEDLGFEHEVSRVQLSWAEGLLAAGEARRARAISERGLKIAQTEIIRVQLHITAAHATAELEEWTECQDHMEQFRSLAFGSSEASFAEWTLYDALRIRLARNFDSPEQLKSTAEMAIHEFEFRVHSMDANQEGHLILQDAQVLRNELHAILADRPELAYELELHWRHIPVLLGRPDVLPLAHDFELSELAKLVERALDEPSKDTVPRVAWEIHGDQLRVLYRVRADSLERWVHSESGLQHDVLPLGAKELQGRVNRLLEQVGHHSRLEFSSADTMDARAFPISSSLARELHEMAGLILPEAILAGDGDGGDDEDDPIMLQLYLDGPLAALPFAVLNLSSSGYSPLIMTHDPVVMGPGVFAREPRAELSRESAVIVADALVTPGRLGGRAGLPALERGVQEARRLKEWLPNSLLLERSAATKPAVLDRWEDASLIYFATHVVKDPQAPYVSYLPLSPIDDTPESRREDAYLDMVDIHDARLVHRPLVVLSACSSGAPFVVRGSIAPGLGTAFLRAGASTVIQTYWSVRDDASAALMHDTMYAWAVEGASPERALNAARRKMATDGKFMHPYFWGSAVVTVSGD